MYFVNRLGLGKLALILCSLTSYKSDLVIFRAADIQGNWVGSRQTRPLGICDWKEPTVAVMATFNVVDDSIIGTIIPIAGTAIMATRLTGKANGSTITLAENNEAICYGTSRSYVNHFVATVTNGELTLLSHDTICPEQDCIFLRTLKLVRP